MRCSKCNREMDNSGICRYCDEANAEPVRILTPDEKSQYRGVTIDTGGEEREARQQRERNRENSGFYMRQIRLNGGGWLSKFMIFAIVASLVSFILFVALPLALIGIGVGIFVWIVLSFFRH